MPRSIEMMRATKALTTDFLSKIGQSVKIPEMPFSQPQVEAVRYYNQYAGGDAEYIPPGLTLDDLAKLGKIDSSLFAIRNKFLKQTTSGGWVLALYGLIPATVGMTRSLARGPMNELQKKFGLPAGYSDFGNLLDQAYLKLLFAKRTGLCYPREQFMWTNEFFTTDSPGYLVLAHTKQLGLYAQIKFSDYGPDLGSSPLFYPADPLLRPCE